MSYAEIRERKIEKLRAHLSRRDETYTSGTVPKSKMGECIKSLRQKIAILAGRLAASTHRMGKLEQTIKEQDQELRYLRQQIAVLRKIGG